MSQVKGARQEVLIPSHTDLHLCIAPATKNSYTYSFNFTYANHVTTVTKAAPIYNFITINVAI